MRETDRQRERQRERQKQREGEKEREGEEGERACARINARQAGRQHAVALERT